VKNGLAEWGQDGRGSAASRAAADFAIYTPGSSAGLPLSILRSLDARRRRSRKTGTFASA
jgi:hypothetical protein